MNNRLKMLREIGFDASAYNRSARAYSVRCNSCEALVINGIPTHERGCPNAVHECAGCNALIQQRQRYCEDCA